MEKATKGIMGYSVAKEGKPATHVILTLEEYDNLLKEIKNTIEDSEKKIADYKSRAENVIRQDRENAQKCVQAVQSDLNESKIEISRLNDLNVNLLRICKERANARRRIKPKKTHHGYIVIESQQYMHTHNVKGNIKKLPCWKVKIQSPYDSSIPYETIKENIQNDFINIFAISLGIKPICNLNQYTFAQIQELWNNDKNFTFKDSYKSNVRSGLWEVEYLVKSSIVVPEDMRHRNEVMI